MPDERRPESADLTDYEALDSSDTLNGAPGDDPLDRGLVTPDRWSAGIRFGTTAAEQEEGESLDQALTKEEPDPTLVIQDEADVDIGLDENATEEEVSRYLLDQGSDPRAGRLVDEDDQVNRDARDARSYLVVNEFTARDAGIDGGGATAEEASIHVVNEDTDTRLDGEP
jgi:Family of unknown function (DUF5709)